MTKELGVFVKSTSRDPVVESFKVIKRRYLPNNKLIANSNKLRKNAILAIDRHNDSTKPFQLKSNDVNTYVAASSLSHLLDGWGYISQGVNALMKGNSGAAIHMAYYAELRAVMSLLASEGIGVFNYKHIGLKVDNNFSLFLKLKKRNETGRGRAIGTHVFAWEAFDRWCKSEVKPSYDILRLFRVKGFNFSELLTGFHPQATQLVSSAIAKSWLKKWAFDVKKYRNDRELRNFVSYRPQTISGFDSHIDFKDTVEKIYGLFHVLSPNSNNPFDFLDKLLLKALFDELYSRPEISSRGPLEDLLNDSFTSVGATLDLSTKNILLSATPIQHSHLIFTEASKKEVSPLPIISRALLLLRVSTGCVSVLLNDSAIQTSDLDFIWGNYGLNNGFWETPLASSDFYNLWTEIETQFSDINLSINSVNNNSFSFNSEFSELDRLSQLNRAGLWGIAI